MDEFRVGREDLEIRVEEHPVRYDTYAMIKIEYHLSNYFLRLQVVTC